ncbi:acyl-CoA dehydrogenase mitochondrial precursor [Aspergillus heteromorphus CBS 117.55]|uniref:Short/branched chain specific acyl-CoA dehydrogenase, mitochondrial n=1 Tax=Aspergillus heteromorphus CBS 117.55 TaxID=1448321 RepID=A0A317W658_9EURO|nr:acyl-CoA dehydrogenase mitochondrial precursor [Aspergillus heteromorphus CBS 117.55]PWY80498.1 acyl-CoA dehydrogenase mitochondrial precursor [Aspergillus heteromorphus CBS 117.55]
MARFQIVSDLHLEKPKAYDLFEIPAKAPYLALLGDIGNVTDDGFLPFIEAQLRKFQIVFLVLGNHEPFHSSWLDVRDKLGKFSHDISLRQAQPQPGSPNNKLGEFVLLDQTRYQLTPDVTVLGCTLHSQVSEAPEEREQVSFGINDFYYIQDWTVEGHCAAHEADRAWLNDQVTEIARTDPHHKIVIFTHHSPTVAPPAVDPAHVNSLISSGFATDLVGEPCWDKPQVRLWAFGHTHYNCDFTESRTGKRIVANQRGYYFAQASAFDPEKSLGFAFIPFDSDAFVPPTPIMASITRALRPLSRSARLIARPQALHRVAAAPSIHAFSTTSRRRDVDLSGLTPTPITFLSETESLMSESVSKFATEQIAPKVRDMDEAETMDPTVVEQLFEQGLMSIEIPEDFGGAGMNFTAAIVAIEELARVDPSVSVLVDVHNTLVNTAIMKYGDGQLKRTWLPKLATGTVGSFCLSEPASGSDAFALQTKAEKTGDGYKINGSKMWITNSMEAGVFIVFANLDPSKGYRGITAFIVEKDTPGLSIAKKEKKLGIRASSTCVLNFDDVLIPKGNLLGEEGQGYKYAISVLNEGRIGIAAQMTGLALGAWENAAHYVWNDRRQFGQLIGEFQGMQHQLAQAYTEIAAARALVYNAARKKEAGQDFVQDAAMAKLYASQVAGRVSGSAVEWMGGMGFVREGIAEKMFRDSKIGAIYEGTSNIQLQTIAKLLQKQYTR